MLDGMVSEQKNPTLGSLFAFLFDAFLTTQHERSCEHFAQFSIKKHNPATETYVMSIDC